MTSTAQPNILFLFPDQWRWDWLGCEQSPYGTVPVKTPTIDALAAKGVRFTQCRTNSPLCAPARAALATGMRYENCGVYDNSRDLDPNRTTFFQLLRDAGYRTLTCGKNDLHKKTTWKGQDGWTQLLGQYGFSEAIDQSGKLDAANNGSTEKGGPNCAYTAELHRHGHFDTYADDYKHRRIGETSSPTATWATPVPDELYTDNFCTAKALELLDRQPEEGPWMLWVNWPGPHDPFDPPAEYRARYDKVAFPEPVNGSDHYRSHHGIDHQQIRRNYAAECENIDDGIRQILAKVEERGEIDNTVIIFASDHGEMLGDHGRFLKSVPQEASTHVTLIIHGPGIEQGVVSDQLVELIDLSASCLQWAGLSIPEHFDARPVFDAPLREIQLSSLRGWQMACDGRYKFWVDGEDQEFLYDLASDPQELNNLADTLPEQASRLRKALLPKFKRT